MVCYYCGTYLPDGAKFCGQCGKAVFKQKKKCPKCKNQYAQTMVFCGNCGTLLEIDNSPENLQLSILTIKSVSLFEDNVSTLLPKKIGMLSFFNSKMTFTSTKIKTSSDNEYFEFSYRDISSVSTTRHYGITGITIKMKNGKIYSFIGSFAQSGYGIYDIEKMILHHIEI